MAAHERKQLAIEYQSYTNEITERVIDPYGIAVHTGIWYAAGYCHLRHDLRTFRLDRIRSVHLTDDTFERPKDFDVLGHVLDSIAQQPGSWTIEIRMKTTFDEARRIFPAYMALLAMEGDEVVMRCYTSQLDWMAQWVLRIPCPFVIVQPVELRQLAREAAEKVMRMIENMG